jgi:hypothetical protein
MSYFNLNALTVAFEYRNDKEVWNGFSIKLYPPNAVTFVKLNVTSFDGSDSAFAQHLKLTVGKY